MPKISLLNLCSVAQQLNYYLQITLDFYYAGKQFDNRVPSSNQVFYRWEFNYQE